MKFILLSIIAIFQVNIGAAQNIKVYTEQVGESIVVYVDNFEALEMSVDISFQLTNMKTDFGGIKKIFVIKKRIEKYPIATLVPTANHGKIGVEYDVAFYYGDVLKKIDEDFIYELPFEANKSYRIDQGYNGRFSHHGDNALDFNLAIGDKVMAARGGTVVKLEQVNNKTCKSPSCKQYNNYLTIYHDDGTFADYVHLKYNGVLVNVGDHVKKGDLIAYSGNTGWSTGPHLHFMVYTYKDGQNTIKTKFATHSKNAVYLEEGKVYKKQL